MGRVRAQFGHNLGGVPCEREPSRRRGPLTSVLSFPLTVGCSYGTLRRVQPGRMRRRTVGNLTPAQPGRGCPAQEKGGIEMQSIRSAFVLAAALTSSLSVAGTARAVDLYTPLA